MKTRELDECPDSVWMPYMVGNDVPIVPAALHPALGAGIYFLFTEDKALIYIGYTLNIGVRVAQHMWAGKPVSYVGLIDVPDEWLRIVETAYIHALDPPLNLVLSRPPHKAMHDRMVPVIQRLWGLG